MGSSPQTYSSKDNRPPPPDQDGEGHQKTVASPSSLPNEPGQPGDSNPDANSSKPPSRALAGLGSTCQERSHTAIDDEKTGSGKGGTASDKLLNTHQAIGKASPMQVESSTPRTHQIWSKPQRHPLDTLRKKGFGSDYGGSRSAGTSTGGMSTADEITKLRASLKRVQEENAWERERREVCDEQARVAYASLEAESKR